jgi:hypothetical protein
MTRHAYPLKVLLGVQAVLFGALAVATAALSERDAERIEEAATRTAAPLAVAFPRSEPLAVAPLFDDRAVVSDAEMAAGLLKIRPKFPAHQRKPNFVEHALRAWGQDATFADPAVMSGVEMREFLLDHGRYAASWGPDEDGQAPTMLVDRPAGVEVQWGSECRLSVHHDHMLACLAEAGVSLEQQVFTPSGQHHNVADVLRQAMRDFRPDERETEWSALAFALYLSPERSWRTAEGRRVDFDLLARRLMRGQLEYGVCSGTHRVYSLMALWRIDQEHDILSDGVARDVWRHLEMVRDLICASQFDDGRWPTNWCDGRAAVEQPRKDDEVYQQVIATGHHLEWLAIAPPELHPPRERIDRAARWLIDDTTGHTAEEIMAKYTFYSHVGNALALWRKTHPAAFWKTWTLAHADAR